MHPQIQHLFYSLSHDGCREILEIDLNELQEVFQDHHRRRLDLNLKTTEASKKRSNLHRYGDLQQQRIIQTDK